MCVHPEKACEASRGWQGLQRFSNTAEFLDIFLWRQILVEVAATHELRIKDTTINHTATGLKRLGRKTEIIFETVGAFIRAVPASRFFAPSFFALVPAVPRRRIQTPTPLPCLPLPLHIPLKRASDILLTETTHLTTQQLVHSPAQQRWQANSARTITRSNGWYL